ncbi:MAG: ABC transporter ATP-binding protein [Chloroflexi bacterium]|jgi:peptide/nickel transport system ATP-binding protein|nr:ABC transporter ATP-binding protein [Chloroflexota bacterium]MBT3670368.1 ABC transporter ATP-binding protein [Chloroflexota bacterium]MBT4002057.1 ABC transporter ATP-binding protein [Chloroflexota bacterium]MBT4305555.1 ABC transporter ATP-binding protein [Chloroflexota bacterium]MBT4533167.1 ABC transporter ATP-binding protein [Chloroflexota bacterium]
MQNNENLFEVKDLVVEYHTRSGVVNAVDQVSFDLKKGEILGLVGESGCGKSTLGKAMMRMIAKPGKISSGELWINDVDLLKLSENEMRKRRGSEISMIFQDPMTSLNPVQRISDHLLETIHTHEPKEKKASALERTQALIERLGIQRQRIDEYPHQLSGGMRQRVMISLGLVLNANLIVADEATTSLDVIVEAKLVDQLKEIRDEFGISIILITHNIALVAQIADRVAVMYAGHIVEISPVMDLFDDAKHPYTRGLLQSVPTTILDEREELYKMPGEPPNLSNPPTGCRFHPRCPDVMPICSQEIPVLQETTEGRFVQCWLYQDHPNKEMSLDGKVS